jgi:uncharacterized protein (TIGR00730 family)
MTTENEIVAIDGWGAAPGAPEVVRFLEGPQRRAEELARATRIFFEFLRGFRALHFAGPCVTVFGSARFTENHPYYHLARRTGAELARAGFTVMTGGGPGIMEAANRGASEAGGKTIGLNIGLPFEQWPNPYITPELSFEFHYFFMRKFWFAYLAKALVVFPGGFGTLDELSEILTLTQTRKIEKRMIIVLYGSDFWKKILNFDALVEYGMISPEDMNLFQFADDPDSALKLLVEGLTAHYLDPRKEQPQFEHMIPAISKSRV